VEASFTIATGALTDRSIRKGCPPTVARKTAMFVGHTLTAAALACWILAGPRWFFLCVFVTFAAWGIAATGIFAFPQALAGPEASGKWTGLQNCFANMAGIIAPAMTGFILDWTGSFAVTLAAAAAVMFIGGLAWVFMVGPFEQVTFEKPATAKILGQY
jgi:MFS transporter, ACS family, D-galactonate transporter